MADPETEVRALLKEHDAVFVRTAKHGDLYRVAGGSFNVPGTSSDRRAWNNSLADLRRLIRGSQVGTVEEFDDEEEDEVGMTPEQIAGLGVHVQRKKRIVETAEVTLSLKAIAQLLGVYEEEAKVTIQGRDFSADEVLTLLVETHREESS